MKNLYKNIILWCLIIPCTLLACACGKPVDIFESSNEDWTYVKRTESAATEGETQSEKASDSESEEEICAHEYDEWGRVGEYTCLEKGFYERSCALCGNVESTMISGEHVYGEDGICEVSFFFTVLPTRESLGTPEAYSEQASFPL